MIMAERKRKGLVVCSLLKPLPWRGFHHAGCFASLSKARIVLSPAGRGYTWEERKAECVGIRILIFFFKKKKQANKKK